EPGLAVHLGAAGAALAGLAVPPDRQVVGLGGLDPVEHVEDDIAFLVRDSVLPEVAATRVATKDVHHRLVRGHHLPSSRSFFSSSGICGSASWVTVIRPSDWRMTTFHLRECPAVLGQS